MPAGPVAGAGLDFVGMPLEFDLAALWQEAEVAHFGVKGPAREADGGPVLHQLDHPVQFLDSFGLAFCFSRLVDVAFQAFD